MAIARTPRLFSRSLSKVTWDFYGDHNRVYLTFDDGPTPGVTPWVLETLSRYEAKATFFCLGRNVEKHPDLYRQILSEGHGTGNHGYSHLKGFRSSRKKYLDDIALASTLISSNLFRPPYGQILPGQIKSLYTQYHIIMWDVLSIDYNTKSTGERVLKNVIKHVRPGSIIVFHDSDKASRNLRYALPRTLEFLKENKYVMPVIPDNGPRDYNVAI